MISSRGFPSGGNKHGCASGEQGGRTSVTPGNGGGVVYRGSEFEIQQDAFRDNLHFFLIGSRSWTLTNTAGVDLVPPRREAEHDPGGTAETGKGAEEAVSTSTRQIRHS